jgi:cell wall-associated NlpC family hydrolase
MTELEQKERGEIVRLAREWMNTPYHPNAKVKGAGVDCAMYPLAVYQQAGKIALDIETPFYPPDWHMHRDEEKYLIFVEQVCAAAGGREISADEVKPGDFALWKIGRTYSHGAIVVEWPLCIHSYIPHGVTLFDASIEARLHDHPRLFFTFWSASE